uniref:Uncharacterized protein n=1 Tax=Clandestinovirus TaxID=2831644 RepID=A0A8F8KPT8_9VIRU|nr:hypothetical protein KOM_12_311 [Clandestinovirus]
MAFFEPVGDNTPFSSLQDYDVSDRILFHIGNIGQDGSVQDIALTEGFGCFDWTGQKIYAYITSGLHWDIFNLPKDQLMHERLWTTTTLPILDHQGKKVKLTIRTTTEGVPLFYVQPETQNGIHAFFDDTKKILPYDIMYFKHETGTRICRLKLKPKQWMMRVRRTDEQPGRYFDTTTLVLTNWEDEDIKYKVTIDAEFNDGKQDLTEIPVIDMDGNKTWLKLLPTGFFAVKGINEKEWEVTNRVVCLGPNRNEFILYCISQDESLRYLKFNPFDELLQ